MARQPDPPRETKPSVAVFVSGGGTNLQALIDRAADRDRSVFEIGLVVASRPGIAALARAERARLPVVVLDDPADGDRLCSVLSDHRVEWIVLAGYLRLVPAAVIDAYEGRIVNLHPALLPAFGGHGMYGRRVHESVLESGARVSGATIHLVDGAYDTGPIVAQWPVLVAPDDTPESLAARIQEVEHRLLPAVLERLVAGVPRDAIEWARGRYHVHATTRPCPSVEPGDGTAVERQD